MTPSKVKWPPNSGWKGHGLNHLSVLIFSGAKQKHTHTHTTHQPQISLEISELQATGQTGQSAKITITYDKIILADIEQMLQEAEEFAEEDKKAKQQKTSEENDPQLPRYEGHLYVVIHDYNYSCNL